MPREERKAKNAKVRRKSAKSDDRKGAKPARQSKKKTAVKHETIEMVCTGAEVGSAIFARLGKDRTVCMSLYSREFIEHLEEPAPGTLTGSQLPYTPLTMMRNVSPMLMDRVLACGPSKDPVLHRGWTLARTVLPMAVPFSLDVVVLLAIPVGPRMATKDRETLQLLQTIARHHHSGYADDFECVVEELTRIAEILEANKDATLRPLVLASLMSKKNLSSKAQKLLFEGLGGQIEVDREQIGAVITALRSRDQLNRDQATKIREELSVAVHERRNGKIRASELIRRIVKIKQEA